MAILWFSKYENNILVIYYKGIKEESNTSIDFQPITLAQMTLSWSEGEAMDSGPLGCV